MKKILPTDYTIDESAIKSMRDCLFEFLALTSAETKTPVLNEGRGYAEGRDVVLALRNLGFEDNARVTSEYLLKLKEKAQLDYAARTAAAARK